MKVKCEHCGATLKVDEGKIPENGAWAKCPKCSERLFLKKPEPAAIELEMDDDNPFRFKVDCSDELEPPKISFFRKYFKPVAVGLIILIIIAGGSWLLIPGPYAIYLKNGRIYETAAYWSHGEDVFFLENGVKRDIPNGMIENIEWIDRDAFVSKTGQMNNVTLHVNGAAHDCTVAWKKTNEYICQEPDGSLLSIPQNQVIHVVSNESFIRKSQSTAKSLFDHGQERLKSLYLRVGG